MRVDHARSLCILRQTDTSPLKYEKICISFGLDVGDWITGFLFSSSTRK